MPPISLGSSQANATMAAGKRQAGPSELLYVLGGKAKTKTPYIEVLDAQATSQAPAPIYTIRPDGTAQYGFMAVDSADNFFVADNLPGATKVLMFGPGQSKPSGVCKFTGYPSNLAIKNGILYVAVSSPADTILEYQEPFEHGTCGQPVQTLTDGIAQRHGEEDLFALTIDSKGNLFDVYFSGNNAYMDEIHAGAEHAVAFTGLGGSVGTFYATSDANDDIVTSLLAGSSEDNDTIAVFPREAKKPKLYYPNGGGSWAGMAFGKGQTELFVVKGAYPSSTVQVIGFNPKTGVPGDEKRAYTNIWPEDQTIAVYSK